MIFVDNVTEIRYDALRKPSYVVKRVWSFVKSRVSDLREWMARVHGVGIRTGRRFRVMEACCYSLFRIKSLNMKWF